MKRSPLLAFGIFVATTSWATIASAETTMPLLDTESIPTSTIIPVEINPGGLTKAAFLEEMLGTSNVLDLLDQRSLLIVTSDMDVAVLAETWLTDLEARQPSPQTSDNQPLLAQVDSSNFLGDQRQPVIKEFEPVLEGLNPLFSPPSGRTVLPPGTAGPPTAYG
ncbi:MAG: hypothetical protein AAGF24_10625, partial [Cyanobacteria bacterium P01_H01_bin.121]